MPAERQLVLHGKCEEVLREIPDNTFDSCATDSPYGLGAEPDPVELLMAWLADGDSKGVGSGGFMGAKWDAFVPSPRIWREVYRVLKPGALLLSFFGTRTYDWGVIALRLAGFGVVDKIDWHHGEGWPKGLNIAKALDKEAGVDVKAPGWTPQSELAQQWEGWNTQLKPASEPIVLCRKPLEGTFIENVRKWGVGGLNVGACKVGTSKEVPASKSKPRTNQDFRLGTDTADGSDPNTGRYPANLILTHDVRCRMVGTKTLSGEFIPNQGGTRESGFGDVGSPSGNGKPCGPQYGGEEVEVWECQPGCPIGLMDAQSGTIKSGKMKAGTIRVEREGTVFSTMSADATKTDIPGDVGGASRFFQHCNYNEEDFLPRFQYCAKASSAERGEYNDHKTVKPRSLMRYLVRLITPPGGVGLDPFCGSGTTLLAAEDEGVSFVGVDMEEEHVEIARHRLADYQPPGTKPPKKTKPHAAREVELAERAAVPAVVLGRLAFEEA